MDVYWPIKSIFTYDDMSRDVTTLKELNTIE